MNAREHALRVAVLDALAAEVGKVNVLARADAAETFAQLRDNGQPQQEVLLPDGTRIGLISINKGTPAVDVDEAALIAWARVHWPGIVQRYLLPGVAENPDVLDLVAGLNPGLVGERISAEARKTLLTQIIETSGYVAGDDGEAVKVAEVTPCKPTGRFSYRPGPDAAPRVITEWRTGRLGEVELGALAIEVGGGGGE